MGREIPQLVFRARRSTQLPREVVHPAGAARKVGASGVQAEGHVVEPVATSEVNAPEHVVTHVHELITPHLLSGPAFKAGGTRHCLRQWSDLT